MSSPEGLTAALADFLSMVLSGGVPIPIRAVFFGAKLHALKKKHGGLRPIAVGLTLRRLASKIASHFAIERLLPILSSRQLGVGAFINSSSPCHALVKLDMVNAFNTLRRDSILETVSAEIPELLPYVVSSYESLNLSFVDFNLQS